MKVLMENWRRYMKEEEEKKKRDGGALGRFLGGEDFELKDDEKNVPHAIGKAIKAKLKKRAEEMGGGLWEGDDGEEQEGEPNLVLQAFENTDPAYLEDSIKRRNQGPDAAGSIFSAPTSIEDLKSAAWTSYPHKAINTSIGAIGFKAPIAGVQQIAGIQDESVPDGVIFQPAHGGRAMAKEPNPETGKPEVLAEVVAEIPEAGRGVEHTTLILGPHPKDKEKLVVWTFHPGDPTPQLPEITLSKVQKHFGTSETQIPGSKQDAIDLGYGFVKHAGK